MLDHRPLNGCVLIRTQPFWLSVAAISLTGLLSALPFNASAATFSVSKNIQLQKVTKRDITGSRGGNQTVDLGSIDGGVISPPSGQINLNTTGTGINRFIYRQASNLWTLSFTKKEKQEDVNITVSYQIEDQTGRAGYISTSGGTSRVGARVYSTGTSNPAYYKNSDYIKSVKGNAEFEFDILNASGSGTHSGTLIIDVTWN